jgi:hypothetical protein
MENDPIPVARLHSDALRVTPPPPDAVPPPNVVPLYRMFSPGQMTGATFFGGPIGGAWLLAINYKRLGSARSAWLAIIAGVVATALLVVLGIALGANGASRSMGLVPIVAMSLLGKALQGAEFERHIARGGPRSSTWAAIGLGIASLGISLTLIFGGAVFAAWMAQPGSVAFANNEVLYDKGGTETEARATGQELTTLGYFTPKSRAAALVRLEGSRHIVALVTRDFAFTDNAVQSQLHAMADALSREAFHGEPLDIWLTDGELEPHTVLHWEYRPHVVDLGHDHLVVYRDGAEENEAISVGKTLHDIGYYQDGVPSRVQVLRAAGRHVVEFRRDGDWDDVGTRERFHRRADELSAYAFHGEPVDIWFADPDDHLKVKLAWEERPHVFDAGAGNGIIYYPGVDESEVRAVAQVLADRAYFTSDHPAEVALHRDDGRYRVGLFLSDSAFTSGSDHAWLRGMADALSHGALEGAPVDIELLDGKNTVRSTTSWEQRAR